MKGQVYMIGGMLWIVIETFTRRKVEWAKMRCLDKPKKRKSFPLEFLAMIAPRQRVS